jgi:translation initiation factor 2-alpha kinase 4
VQRVDGTRVSNNSNSEDLSNNTFGSIVLVIRFTKGYPLRAPIVSLEKVSGLSKNLIKDLEEKIESTISDLIGTVMIYQLCFLCQEYLDTHCHKPEVGSSLYEKLMRDREDRKRIEELEMLKLEEKRKEHNKAVEKEILEIRKQKEIKRKKLKEEKQRYITQYSTLSPDSDWDVTQILYSDNEYSVSSESEELMSSDNDKRQQKIATINFPEEDINLNAYGKRVKIEEQRKEIAHTNRNALEKRTPIEEGLTHFKSTAGKTRFKFDVTSITSDSDLDGDSGEYSEDEQSDTTEDYDTNSSQYTFDVEFSDDMLTSDFEDNQFGSSPLKTFGLAFKAQTSGQTTDKVNYERQLLLVHLLHHFTETNLKNETNAFNELVEQLQKIGILDTNSNWSDLKLLKQRFSSTFSEQISLSETRGNIFSSLWKPPTLKAAEETQKIRSRYKEDFQELGPLGSGAFGEVIKVKNNLDQRIYAIKKIIFPHDYDKEEKKILREVSLLSRLHHPNIIRYYNAWIEECDGTSEPLTHMNDQIEEEKTQNLMENGKYHVLYIQMECCTDTVKDLIEKGAFQGNKEEAWRLLHHIVMGLAYLDEKNIIHRDLKPGNLLLGVDGDVKIGDFGLSCIAGTKSSLNRSASFANLSASDEGMSGVVGTPLYMSPEMDKGNYTSKADIFSLGIIFFEMLHAPFSTSSEKAAAFIRLKESGKVPDSFPKTYEKEAQLIEMLVNADPEKRPSAAQILQSNLLPVKMEEQYLRALFSQKEDDFMLGKVFNHSNQYYREKITLRVQAIFQLHGAVQFDVSPYLPNSEQVVALLSKEKLFPIVTKTGKLVNLTSDGTLSFARYLSRLPENAEFLKRYSLQQVFRNKHGTLSNSHIFSFDIVGSTYKLITEVEILKVLSSIIGQFKPKKDGDFIIRISHSAIFQAILDLCKINKKHVEQICHICTKVSKLTYSWNQAKDEMVNNLGILEDSAAKLIKLLSIKGEISAVHQRLLRIIDNSKARESLTDIATLLSHLDIWPVTNCELQFDLSCCFAIHRYSGIVIECGIRRRKRYISFAYGGRYDKLVSEFAIFDKKPHHVVGINIRLDRMIRETVLIEHVGSTGPTVHNSSVPDVIVCSTGRNMLEERMKIADALWNSNIKCDLMYDDRMSLGKVKQFCQKHRIRCVVITDPTLKSNDCVKVLFAEVHAADPSKRMNVVEIEKKELSNFLKSRFVTHEWQDQHSITLQNLLDPKMVTILSPENTLKQVKQKKVVIETAVKHVIEKCSKMQSGAHILAVCLLTREDIQKAIELVVNDDDQEAINHAAKEISNKNRLLFLSLIKNLRELNAKKVECVYVFSVDDKQKTEFFAFSFKHFIRKPNK